MRTRVGIGIVLSGVVAVSAVILAQGSVSPCAADNGGITLPTGFCASVFADKLGPARHMAVSPTGDVYVALRLSPTATSQGVLALRDANKDGKAEVVERLPLVVTTGIEWRNDYLYYSDNSSVSRVQMKPGELKPVGAPEVIVSGLTDRRQHADKPFTFDEAGNLYVNIGAPSNTCQQDDRKAGSPGRKPCSILEEAGGIWRFKADTPGQTQKDGHRYSTGIRNAVAIAFNATDKQVYVVQHGRDALDTLFPQGFTARQNADLPAEELFRLSDGADFGWPYCYFDIVQKRKVLSPEYGGDGKAVGDCDKRGQPLVTFPAHNAPNDIAFYTARQFPEKYRNGAFVALHGSWNRAPFDMDGYKVVFVPFTGKGPAGTWEAFADGFPGKPQVKAPNDAAYRPTGLAVGLEGELYISDDTQGRIWRVVAIH